MRQCPTPEGHGGPQPLITHSITSCQCVERQDDFYHKCHRCLYRGKPADFVLADGNGDLQNGVVAPARRPVEPLVEIPGRNGVPAKEKGRMTTDPAVPDPAPVWPD